MNEHWTCPSGTIHPAAVLSVRSMHRTADGVVTYRQCACGHTVFDLTPWDAYSTSIASRVSAQAPRASVSAA